MQQLRLLVLERRRQTSIRKHMLILPIAPFLQIRCWGRLHTLLSTLRQNRSVILLVTHPLCQLLYENECVPWKVRRLRSSGRRRIEKPSKV